jgi:hypothetical protein
MEELFIFIFVVSEMDNFVWFRLIGFIFEVGVRMMGVYNLTNLFIIIVFIDIL